jgi:uncharacterized membrane protein YgaE (UPF0421/DUF939 family)
MSKAQDRRIRQKRLRSKQLEEALIRGEIRFYSFMTARVLNTIVGIVIGFLVVTFLILLFVKGIELEKLLEYIFDIDPDD